MEKHPKDTQTQSEDHDKLHADLSDAPIWTTNQLVEFSHHDDLDIREWAFRRLTLQAPDETRKQCEIRDLDPEIYLDPPEQALLKQPEDPERVQKLAYDLKTSDDPGTVIDREAMNLEMEQHVFLELQSALEEMTHLLDMGEEWLFLLICRMNTTQLAFDLLRPRLTDLLKSTHYTNFWETFEELGDPRAIDPLLSEWHPGEKHASRVLYLLGRLADAVDQLPSELVDEAKEVRNYRDSLLQSDTGERSFDQLIKDDEPHELPLRCKKCDRTYIYTIDLMYIVPEESSDSSDESMKRIPNRVIRCKHCDAADEYEFTSDAFASLTAGLMKANSSGELPDNIEFADLRLYDGTRFDRPTEGLNYLRNKAREHPEDPEMWMHLGILAVNFQELDEAESAYQKACERRTDEVGFLIKMFGLASRLEHSQEAANFLQKAVVGFPDLSLEERKKLASELVGKLSEQATKESEPFYLNVTWEQEEERAKEKHSSSAIDLSAFSYWEELEFFLGEVPLVDLNVGRTKMEEQTEDLERIFTSRSKELNTNLTDSILTSGPRPDRGSSTGSQQRVVSEKPGRNDPCHCGSGKKYKKCCWRTDRLQ